MADDSRVVELAGWSGPWADDDPDANFKRDVALYGLAVWEEVAPETRDAIDHMMTNGMRRDPAQMLQIAQRRGRLDVACRHSPGLQRQTDSKWVQLCQSMEATL